MDPKNSYVVDAVRGYLESEGKAVNAMAMEVAIERLKKSFSGQFSTDKAPRDTSQIKLYPSEAGKCERQIEYKALGIQGEPMLADVQFKLAMGDLVEMALMYIIECAPGVTVKDNNKIRDIEIGDRKWRGATDGIHYDGAGRRRNLEVKSASGIGFKMTIERGIDDNFGYLTQTSVYLRQLLKDGAIDEPETIFVYIDRDSMKLWETVVRYDPALATAADEKFLRVITAVNQKKILPRPYQLEAGGALPLNCRYCQMKHTCWVEPRQVVQYEEGRPVYRIKPTVQVEMVMKGRKPAWFVVGQ